MNLGEYIEVLEKYDRDKVVALGLGNPHSWRGSYDEISFEPVENTTVGEMIDSAKSALNETMYGYKGGEFLMTSDTTINIDYSGNWSDGTQAMKMLFDLMMAA